MKVLNRTIDFPKDRINVKTPKSHAIGDVKESSDENVLESGVDLNQYEEERVYTSDRKDRIFGEVSRPFDSDKLSINGDFPRYQRRIR